MEFTIDAMIIIILKLYSTDYQATRYHPQTLTLANISGLRAVKVLNPLISNPSSNDRGEQHAGTALKIKKKKIGDQKT